MGITAPPSEPRTSKAIDRDTTLPAAEESTTAGPTARLIRVGLVQRTSAIGTESHDPRNENLERALRDIDTLASDDVQLIVFGEMYLSGYHTDEHIDKWATTPSVSDPHVAALAAAAKERDVHVIIGAGTFGEFVPGDVYNSALLIGPAGLVGVYRKSHVAAYYNHTRVSKERSFYSPGRDLPVFDTPLGRIGIHICYDILFPEVARVQALKGAELLVNVSASSAGRQDLWDHAMYMRAVENASWYAACSVVGVQRGDGFFGGSRVVDPSGKTVAMGKYDEEDTVVADVDLEGARRIRASTHIFNTRQPDLYRAIAEPSGRP